MSEDESDRRSACGIHGIYSHNAREVNKKKTQKKMTRISTQARLQVVVNTQLLRELNFHFTYKLNCPELGP